VLDPATGNLFAGTHKDGIYMSSDGGRTWDERDTGVAYKDIYTLHAAQYPEGLRLYAGTEPAYLYASDDLGMTWEELPGLPLGGC